MAVTIDWGTKVITVPRVDLTLIQSTPVEIREMDLNWFHRTLRSLEASVDGMPMLSTHKHNTEVTLGSLTFARIIEIINGYTVTFEDGQYAVNLVGANSNVGDKVNVNQVSVRSQNSAGLISSPDIEFASFNGGVTIDVNSGHSGTLYPRGTERMKVDNISDALLIADYRGFNKFYFHSDITLHSDAHLDNFILEGQSHVNIDVNIDAAADVQNTVFVEMGISGTLDGGNSVTKCIVGDITYLNGHIHDSALVGTIALGGNKDAYLVNCSMADWDHTPVIDMGSAGQDLILIQFTGMLQIKNMHSTNKVGIGLVGGVIELDSATVSSGLIQVSGTGRLTDTNGNHIESGTWNGGVTIINELISSDGMSSSKRVYIDSVHGGAGTGYPLGELNSPVNNIEDAIDIAENYGIDHLHVSGALTIGATDDVSGYTFSADRSLGNSIIVTSGATTSLTYFENLTVSGTMGGSVRYTTCVLGAINNFDGGAKNSLLTGDIVITGTGANYFTECDTYITDSSAYKQLDVGNKLVNLIRCRGNYEIENKTGTSTTAIDLVAGTVQVNSTCTAGVIFMDGIVHTIDNSAAGCSVIMRNAIDTELLVEGVWEADLSGYGDGTAGKTLVDAEDEIRQAGRVYWDSSSSNTGTDYPIGSKEKPAKNVADAITVADRYGIKTIVVAGFTNPIPVGVNLSNFIIEGSGLAAYVQPDTGATVSVVEFNDVIIQNTYDGVNKFHGCMLYEPTIKGAYFTDCMARDRVSFFSSGSWFGYFMRCEAQSNLNLHEFTTLDVYDADVRLTNCSGDWAIANKDVVGNPVHVNLTSGRVRVDSTCTAGEIIISGADEVIDNSSAGCTVTVISSEVNIDAIVDGVWDEMIADHMATGSTGKALASAGSGVGDPTIVAAAVWNEPIATHVVTGTFGELVQKVKFWVSVLRKLL